MAEYIEREKAIDYLMEIIDRPNHPEWLWTDEICSSLKTIPAADVRPVRHGRWTGHDVGNGKLSIDEDTCSLCGSRFYQIAETGCDWNYCPNCGCAMEES